MPHATAGLAVIELGSGTESDLADALARLLPRDDRYRHKHGSTGHGADHLLPAFVSPSLTIPVIEGRAQLGTWQSVVLVDTNVDNPVAPGAAQLPGRLTRRRLTRPRWGCSSRFTGLKADLHLRYVFGGLLPILR